MVENFKNAYKTGTHTKAYQAPCVSQKRDESHGSVSFDVSIIGVPDKQLDNSDIVCGIIVDKIHNFRVAVDIAHFRISVLTHGALIVGGQNFSAGNFAMGH